MNPKPKKPPSDHKWCDKNFPEPYWQGHPIGRPKHNRFREEHTDIEIIESYKYKVKFMHEWFAYEKDMSDGNKDYD